MAEKFRARVNGSLDYELSMDELSSLDLIRTGPDTFHLLNEHRSENIRIEKADFLKGYYEIGINEEKFRVQLSTPLDLFIEEMGFASGTESEVDTVIAPMPGLLLDIYVKEGQEVEKDEPLLVLEAMKMENVILSPRKGVISRIAESKGISVEKGAELILFQ